MGIKQQGRSYSPFVPLYPLEAIRNQVFDSYNAVTFANDNDYMGNPEKANALFTVNQERLSDSEKQELKDAFSIAEKTAVRCGSTPLVLTIGGFRKMGCMILALVRSTEPK